MESMRGVSADGRLQGKRYGSNEIRDIYKGLWEIEESFKIIKSEFKTRPVFVSTEDHIQAHFLICFATLLVMRVLEQLIEKRHSVRQIRNSLASYSCSYLDQNYYLSGRQRWKIENEGLNSQKNYGYFLEHLFSKDYQALKNHYYLMQIGLMISQVMEAWERIWKKTVFSLSEKHGRIWESFRSIKLYEHRSETGKRFQIRFQ